MKKHTEVDMLVLEQGLSELFIPKYSNIISSINCSLYKSNSYYQGMIDIILYTHESNQHLGADGFYELRMYISMFGISYINYSITYNTTV